MIDGDAAIVILNDTFQHVGERTPDVQVDNILATCHNLLRGLITETDDALQHTPLLLYLFIVGQLQRLLQIIHTQYMTIRLQHPLS